MRRARKEDFLRVMAAREKDTRGKIRFVLSEDRRCNRMDSTGSYGLSEAEEGTLDDDVVFWTGGTRPR